MNLPEEYSEHYKTLFDLIVQSCKDERLAVLPVRTRGKKRIEYALVSVTFDRDEENTVEMSITPLAVLASPTILDSISPIISEPLDLGNWQREDIELDDRERWRPPTRGTL